MGDAPWFQSGPSARTHTHTYTHTRMHMRIWWYRSKQPRVNACSLLCLNYCKPFLSKNSACTSSVCWFQWLRCKNPQQPPEFTICSMQACVHSPVCCYAMAHNFHKGSSSLAFHSPSPNNQGGEPQANCLFSALPSCLTKEGPPITAVVGCKQAESLLAAHGPLQR